MKYKKGDTVKIKSLEELKKVKGVEVDEDDDVELGGTMFSKEYMGAICNTSVEILSTNEEGVCAPYDYAINIDGENEYYISDWMIADESELKVNIVNNSEDDVVTETYTEDSKIVELNVETTGEGIIHNRVIYDNIRNGDIIMAGDSYPGLPHFDQGYFVGKDPTSNFYIVVDEDGCVEKYDLILSVKKYAEMVKEIEENTLKIKKDYFEKYGLGEVN